MSFSIQPRNVGSVVVLDMSGRLSFPDPHIAPMMSTLVENGQRSFVINLAEVSYVDSYGVGDLITAYKLVTNAGGKINVLKPNPNIRKLLNLTVKNIFEIYDDESTAVKAATG